MSDFGKLTSVFELVENREEVLNFDDTQASHLGSLSNSLASTKSWWGSVDGETPDRQVIRISAAGPGQYRVMVRDAVGVVSIPGATIIVKPKIPQNHFSYIAKFALFSDPRTASSSLELEKGENFHEILMAWFLEEVRTIVARGIQSDYESLKDSLSFVRGRMDLPSTYMKLATGKIRVDCEFDERTLNTRGNRIIAAALKAAHFESLPSASLQALGHRLRSVFVEIPMVRPTDLVSDIRNVEMRYRKAVSLGMAILSGTGRSLALGAETSRTFLVQSSPLVELGLRRILELGLLPIAVKKFGKALTPSMSVNPDLAIARQPFTADIKYKKTGKYWNRNDLAQSVFFAEAFQSPIAAVVTFSEFEERLEDVPVGRINVRSIEWDLRTQQPNKSAEKLVQDFSKWLPAAELKEYFGSAAPLFSADRSRPKLGT